MPEPAPPAPTFWRGHDGELESADDYPYFARDVLLAQAAREGEAVSPSKEKAASEP